MKLHLRYNIAYMTIVSVICILYLYMIVPKTNFYDSETFLFPDAILSMIAWAH